MNAPLFGSDETLRHRIILFGALLAAALIGFGLILWIAANWDAMSRMVRLGIVGGALAAGCLAAVAHPALRVPGALVAFCAIGGWFALIGQVYQSGADPWQLFALWAALALPLCLAARHDVIWLPWSVVALAGIALWAGGHGGVFAMPDQSASLAGWAMAAAVVAGLALIDRGSGETRWAFRTAALLTIVLITVTALWPAFTRNQGLTFLGIAALAAAAYAFFLRKPASFGLMAAATLGIDTLAIVLVARALLENARSSEFSGFLFVGLIAAAIVGGSASLLLRLSRAGADDAASEARSWPITVLSGIGALIAAIPLLAFLALAFSELFKSPALIALAGAMLLAAAIALLRSAGPLSFRQQFSFIAMVVAFALLAFGSHQLFGLKQVGLVMAVLYIATALLAPSAWIRALLGFATAGALAFWLELAIFGTLHTLMRWPAWIIMAIGAAIALYFARPDRGRHPMLPPFFGGFAAAALTAMMVLAGQTFLLGGIIRLPLGESGTAAYGLVPRLLGGAAGLAGGALLMVLGSAPFRTPLALTIFGIALVFSGLTTPLGPALLLLAVALVTGRTVLAGLAVVACLWIMGAFYYWLGWPLDQKAFLLIGLGALLALVTVLTGRAAQPPEGTHDGMQESVPLARIGTPALAAAMIALSAIATGAIAGKTIADKEAVIREGRPVFIALAPVDPRSLMQGDYMALRFALPNNARGQRATHALASVDSRGIATVTKMVDGPSAPQAGEILLALKHKNGQPILGTDAWFFKEGTAKTFEAARFGAFRVSPSGEMILTGMADKDLAPLR